MSEHEAHPVKRPAIAAPRYSNLESPFITAHDCKDFRLHVLSPWWASQSLDSIRRQLPRRPLTSGEQRLFWAHAEVKRRILAVYRRGFEGGPGYPDGKATVRCWACRDTWLPRGGGMTCLAETDDGIPIGFDVCDECTADLGRLEFKVREALEDRNSPARLG